MTPERLADLRALYVPDDAGTLNSMQLRQRYRALVALKGELLDVVEALRAEIKAQAACAVLNERERQEQTRELRGEIADLLSRLDAAAFGATQVREALEAADAMRVHYEQAQSNSRLLAARMFADGERQAGRLVEADVIDGYARAEAYDAARAKVSGVGGPAYLVRRDSRP